MTQKLVENFIFAAGDGNNEAVVRFLDKQEDVIDEKMSTSGRTALMWAARMGRRDTVSLLLERGAGIEEKDLEGKTALMLAAWNAHKDAAEFLLEKGARIDEKDNRGWTALMLAAGYGQEDLVRLLLKKGADTKMVNDEGDTAAVVAQKRGLTEIAALLDISLFSPALKQDMPVHEPFKFPARKGMTP